jgi:AmmeMemoRadiSam system protein A
MSPLSSHERRALLDLARRAIVEAVGHERLPEIPTLTGALAQPAGAFVTLHRRGQLCGCIGQVGPTESLAETVVSCAIGAATKDPRFEPPSAEEIGELEIEISVLSAVEPIDPQTISVGRHGLLVVRGNSRGVLLPQVATEHGWTRERFLEETCGKAGLESDAWKDSATRVLAFTAEVFSETDFQIRWAV